MDPKFNFDSLPITICIIIICAGCYLFKGIVTNKKENLYQNVDILKPYNQILDHYFQILKIFPYRYNDKLINFLNFLIRLKNSRNKNEFNNILKMRYPNDTENIINGNYRSLLENEWLKLNNEYSELILNNRQQNNYISWSNIFTNNINNSYNMINEVVIHYDSFSIFNNPHFLLISLITIGIISLALLGIYGFGLHNMTRNMINNVNNATATFLRSNTLFQNALNSITSFINNMSSFFSPLQRLSTFWIYMKSALPFSFMTQYFKKH